MTQLTLSDEQSRLLAGASLPIVVFDSRGMRVGEIRTVEPASVNVQSMTDDEWTAECLRRRDQARRDGGVFYTTQEVLAHLSSLDDK